jgi:hypothetical protein
MNTEHPVQYNPDDKQRDERFPKYEPEYAGDDKRDDDGCCHIHDRDVEDSVSMRAFSRTSEYIFIFTEVDAKYFHRCICLLAMVVIIYNRDDIIEMI